MALKTIEKLTKLDKESQNRQIRLFARLMIEEKIQIMKLQKPLFHKLKNSNKEIDNSILNLSSLIIAINDFQQSSSDIKVNTSIFKSKIKKESYKRSRILTLWSIIKELKEKRNMSFRKIPDYLRKYHKFEVSYSTIYQMWNEIEN